MSNKDSLTQQAGRSALWQIAGGGWLTFVRILSSVILARALTPDDYGVFAMAALMREFIQQLGNMNMGTGIIAKETVTEEDLCTCFWMTASVRVLLFCSAFLLAPLGSWFFHDPRVVNVVRIISFTFLFSIFSGVSGTLLQKNLNFKALNIIQGGLAVLESGIAVFLALTTDLGFWVLVIGMLCQSISYHFAIFFVARWWPRFIFSRKSFKYLFHFGANGLGFNITNYLKQNLDYLIVGRILGTASLGLYEFAYRIPHIIQDRISRPVGSVIFPALAKIRNNDERLAYGYIQTVKYVSLISFPFLFGLAAVADVGVPVMWGNQWLPVIRPLRILCLCVVLRIVPQPVGAIFYCKNRPDIPFKLSLIGLIWTAIVVGLFGFLYGIIGVAIGTLFSIIPGYVSVIMAWRMIKQDVKLLLKQLIPIIVASFSCGIGAYGVSSLIMNAEISIFFNLVASIISGMLIYIIVIYFVFKNLFNDAVRLFENVTRLDLSKLKRE